MDFREVGNEISKWRMDFRELGNEISKWRMDFQKVGIKQSKGSVVKVKKRLAQINEPANLIYTLKYYSS